MKVPNLGYVRGTVANHQDYDVYSEVHKASGGSLNVSVVTRGQVKPDFFWDFGKINRFSYTELSEAYKEFAILDTSEFYRDYSMDILSDFGGIKVVTVFDNLPFGISRGSAGDFSKLCHAVIARTPMIKKMLILEGVRPEKIHIVPSAVNTDLFTPSIYTNQEPRVLFVGRIVPEKGLWDLIVAMSGLDAQLCVIGEGDASPYIDLAKNCGTNIQFLGPMPQHKIAQQMSQSSILVVPSIPKIDVYNPEASWVEQFGVVILEGMSSGIPVIVSDTGSTREIIQDGETGLLFPPRNWDILRDHIRQLLESYGMRNKLGSAGRARVIKNFSTKVVGAKLAEVYTSLL